MLDSKTGQCKMKHIDTRFHWIKRYVEENKVKVNYVKSENKSENNVADFLTKNLQPRLFKKHASKVVTNIVDKGKQMNDVGFFVRCKKIRFPRKYPMQWRSKHNRNVAQKLRKDVVAQCR